ncbi:hypothetical protein FI667_g9351, partial [Globisporangium splendens]
MKHSENERELHELDWFAASDEDGSSECSDGYDSTDDQLKLDLEVKQFLEAESYRVEDTRRRLALLQTEDVVVLNEESLFMGINESIAVPDLDGSAFALIEELRQCPTLAARETMATKPGKVTLAPSNAAAQSDAFDGKMLKDSKCTPALPHHLQQDLQSKCRRTMKDELDFLRQHVKDLEDKLTELKLAQASNDDKTISTVIDKEVAKEAKVDNSQTQRWEQIAEHQWDEQQRAIERNTKLKELLEWQLKIVHNLSKAIRKRPFPICETAHCASRHARKMQRRVVHASMTTSELLGDTAMGLKRTRKRDTLVHFQKSVKDLENELRQLDQQDAHDSP